MQANIAWNCDFSEYSSKATKNKKIQFQVTLNSEFRNLGKLNSSQILSSYSGLISKPLFMYSSSVYSCHLFLVSSASVRSIPFLSFIEPNFAWNVPLLSLMFLKRCLVFPILLFSSISLHWSLKKAFLFLLAILCNSASRCLYLSFSPLLFTSFHSYL